MDGQIILDRPRDRSVVLKYKHRWMTDTYVDIERSI
jgi:hypothetical protein